MRIQNLILHVAALYLAFRKSINVSSSFLGCNENKIDGQDAWLLQIALYLV